MAEGTGVVAAGAAAGKGGRQAWVDLAKGVAIVMVVAYHALLFLASSDVGVAPLGRARLALELYPMPAFFLLAGVMQRRLVTSPWSLVWQRRVLPLLYLLVVWTLVRFAFFTLVPGARSDGPRPGDDPATLLLAVVAPSSIYWFLWALALVTVVTWLARRHPATSVGAAVLVSGAVTSGLVVTDVFAWDRALAFLAPYVVGVHAGPWVLRAVTAMRWRHVAAALGTTVLLAAALVAVPLARNVPCAALLGEAALLAGAFGAAHLVADRAWTRPLRDLGRRSLPVYLVHLYPVVLLTLAVREVPALHGTPARGMPLVALVTALALGASLLLARALPTSWRLLQPPPALLRPRGGEHRPAGPAADEHTGLERRLASRQVSTTGDEHTGLERRLTSRQVSTAGPAPDATGLDRPLASRQVSPAGAGPSATDPQPEDR